MKSFKIALAQFSPHIGNLEANAQKMLEQANEAKKQNADLIIFPELSSIGYPAEDLLLRPSLTKRTQQVFEQLKTVKDIVMVFGFVNQTEDGQRYNAAAVMKDGQVLGVYNKQNLVLATQLHLNCSLQSLCRQRQGHLDRRLGYSKPN